VGQRKKKDARNTKLAPKRPALSARQIIAEILIDASPEMSDILADQLLAEPVENGCNTAMQMGANQNHIPSWLREIMNIIEREHDRRATRFEAIRVRVEKQGR
jgi:hypothetical protein